MPTPVTMTDVARAAGVSVMTVSNVVNDRPRVSERTRQRVLEVVADLGYEVNLTARRLRAGRTDTVALVVPQLAHLYFGELGRKLSENFAEQGKHLVVEQSGASREGELSALSNARLRMYDGIIVSAVGLAYGDIDRLRPGIPTVLLGERTVPDRFDHVMMANEEGALLAVRHLLETGARRVAIVGGTPDPTATQEATIGQTGASTLRTLGWQAAHAERGLVADPDLVVSVPHLDAAEAVELTTELLRRRPDVDAIFAVTDQVALGSLAALHSEGRRVPDDVQVVGFDNLALLSLVPPGLSSVDPGSPWIAEQAAEVLLARINGSDLPPQHLSAPARLVLRGSTR